MLGVLHVGQLVHLHGLVELVAGVVRVARVVLCEEDVEPFLLLSPLVARHAGGHLVVVTGAVAVLPFLATTDCRSMGKLVSEVYTASVECHIRLLCLGF